MTRNVNLRISRHIRRAERNEPGLSNADVRAITHFDRTQIKRLMDELRNEGQAAVKGRGRHAVWVFTRMQAQ